MHTRIQKDFLRRAALVAVLGLCTSAGAQAADRIEVELDNAKLLKLPAGTDTLVIGNPTIADVTIQRNQVMVVTAKSHGSTNMIALDSKGAIVSESRIVVVLPKRPEQLTLLRGSAQETYSCNPECGSIIQLGDEDKYFKGAIGQVRDRVTATK